MSTKTIPNQEAKRSSIKKQKMETHMEIVDLDDDDGFFSAPISNQGTNKKDPISVEQYSEERDLNLAIVASLKGTNFVDLSQENYQDYYSFFDDGDGDDDDLKVLTFKPKNTPFGKRKKPFSGLSVTETGQSSNSIEDNNNNPCLVCDICTEPKSLNESFNIMGCSHSYCTDCMVKYVASKLQENITCIQCPVVGCIGLLEPEYCRPILPKEVFERWGNALCEAVILESQKFYCPFKDCSAMLIDDGEEVIKESECPNCRRMFCVQCKVAWHAGIECEEFQKLNKDEREKEDIMLMNLAKNKQWRRCPRCMFYVERSEGCLYMKCRCGIAFCYGCGSISVSNSHFCHNCKR